MVRINVKALTGWAVFIVVYAWVWDASIAHMIRHAQPLVTRASKEAPAQRAAILLIGSYTACRATLLYALYMLLMYSVMSIVQCVLPFPPHSNTTHHAVTWLFSEDILFLSMQPKFLPFHGAVLLSSVAIATLYAVVYPSDADLADPGRTSSIIVRDALCMAAVGALAYFGMALSVLTITRS